MPAMVFFKKGEDIPVIFAGEWGFVYLRSSSSSSPSSPPPLSVLESTQSVRHLLLSGDFKKSERILEWLINQKDPMLDRIEEVDGGTLRKLIDTADHLAVYFCEYSSFLLLLNAPPR